MLSRKDGTIVELSHRPSVRNADIGDPFANKFIGKDFQAVFSYDRLAMVTMKEEILSFFFSDGVSIECEGSNLRAILDSAWTASLQVVEETQEIRNGSRLLTEGEIVVESLRYCSQVDE